MLDNAGFELAEGVLDDDEDAGESEYSEKNEKSSTGDINLAEVIVAPDSILVRRTATLLNLRKRYSINVIAVARQGKRLQERIGKIRFLAGDILLLQGQEEALQEAIKELGCLPLAKRGLRIGKPRRILLALGLFGAALALIAFNLTSASTALVCGAVAMVLIGLLSPGEAYKSINFDVIVLLAAMIPIGQALESTGGAQLIADWMLGVIHSSSPAAMLTLLMIATMLLSNVVNNAAAAILVAPIAIDLARGIDASADPFLMAVAIGASSAFLTPIGHQSNTLVMAPGGYKFSDYWRLGLPLSIVVVAIAVPFILWFWNP